MTFEEWFEQRYPPAGASDALVRESCRDISRDAWEAAEAEGYKAGLMDGSETVRRLVRNVVGPD